MMDALASRIRWMVKEAVNGFDTLDFITASEHAHMRLLDMLELIEAPQVEHPDGKRFYRNSADQWLPLE